MISKDTEITTIRSMLYDKTTTTREERYKKFICSFFSEKRDEIWDAVVNVNDNPDKFIEFGQDPRINILLHGPPGTGKTSLVNRIAITLNRHIVSLDITQFINNRNYLYQTIYDGCVINNTWVSADRYIVLLEEFDIVVNYFIRKKEKESQQNQAVQLASDPDLQKGKSRPFELEDLLELLQGAIPAPERILFATTNHYDSLVKILPSLFRPGRLTPIKCDNISWKSLQQLSEFYFSETIKITEPKKINLCTAEILQLAMECKLNSKIPIDSFTSKIQEKLSLC